MLPPQLDLRHCPAVGEQRASTPTPVALGRTTVPSQGWASPQSEVDPTSLSHTKIKISCNVFQELEDPVTPGWPTHSCRVLAGSAYPPGSSFLHPLSLSVLISKLKILEVASPLLGAVENNSWRVWRGCDPQNLTKVSKSRPEGQASHPHGLGVQGVRPLNGMWLHDSKTQGLARESAEDTQTVWLVTS